MKKVGIMEHASKLSRLLDAVEETMQMPGRMVMAYRGDINKAALTRAIRELGMRHPVLRARIRSNYEGHLLEVPNDGHIKFRIVRGDRETMRKEYADDWDPFDCAVFQLKHICAPGEGFLVAYVSHTIADGAALIAYLHELWFLYGEFVSGRDVGELVGRSLPRAPSELLRQRWTDVDAASTPETRHLTIVESDMRTVVPDSPELNDLVDASHERIHISEAYTARLISAARAHEISAHLVVSGAIILAALAEDRPPTKAAEITFQEVVNLRNHVLPPVNATDTTNFVGAFIASIMVPAGANAITVGEEMRRMRDAAIVNREIYLYGLSSKYKPAIQMVERHGFHIMNSGGLIPRFAPSDSESSDGGRTDDLRIEDLFFDAGERLKMSRSGCSSMHAILTYNGRMSIYGFYPLGSAEQWQANILAQLNRFVSEH